MSKYSTLISILDSIRKEAPTNYKKYYPPQSAIEAVSYARSRALVHLFLKVRFGITDFLERELFITDEGQDGGIDGYYIDQDTKQIFFIQSKFRASEQNFNAKEVLATELLQMDVDRITAGETADARGTSYNNKVLKLVEEIKNISDIGRWKYVVVILANLPSKLTLEQIKRVTGGQPIEVFDHERIYSELVFPVIQGTYFNPNELTMN
jgi:hypothetical protein